MRDPRDTNTGWDDGWEASLDDGHQFEDNYLTAEGDGFESTRGFRKDRFDYDHLGANEPEDPYRS